MRPLITPPPEYSEAQLAPVLDAALAGLNDSDRAAILLHYLEQRSVEEVSHTLRVSPDTARRRISRALARLRKALGVGESALSASALGAFLASTAGPPCPNTSSISSPASPVPPLPPPAPPPWPSAKEFSIPCSGSKSKSSPPSPSPSWPSAPPAPSSHSNSPAPPPPPHQPPPPRSPPPSPASPSRPWRSTPSPWMPSLPPGTRWLTAPATPPRQGQALLPLCLFRSRENP